MPQRIGPPQPGTNNPPGPKTPEEQVAAIIQHSVPILSRGGASDNASTYPCGQQRDPTDIAGRINDLINCYLQTLGQMIPLIIIGIILLVIMILAAREMLKG